MSLMTSAEGLMTKEEYIKIRELIYEKSGMFFPENRQYFLEPKLKKRLEALNLSSFMDYFWFLQSASKNHREWTILFNEITVNETYFFRDKPLIDAFEQHVLIPLIEERIKQKNKKIKIWSSACSTGEEPYTIAMLLIENLQNYGVSFDIEILASDLSSKVLEAAKQGIYNQRSVQYVPSDYLKNHFTIHDGKYKIKESVKQLVKFSPINLIDEGQLKPIFFQDMIFCRNVLIYFDDKGRKNVINTLYNKLNPGGYLFLGHAETLHNITKSFKLILFNQAKAYKKE